MEDWTGVDSFTGKEFCWMHLFTEEENAVSLNCQFFLCLFSWLLHLHQSIVLLSTKNTNYTNKITYDLQK